MYLTYVNSGKSTSLLTLTNNSNSIATLIHKGADGKFYGARGEYRGHSVVRGGGSKKGGGISGFFKALFGSR